MAEQRPSRSKKSSAAITNPDNIAAPALRSHQSAADAAKVQREALAKSQAVTQPAADDDSDSNPPTSDSDSQHLNQAVPGPSTTATRSGDEDNDGLLKDVEVMEISDRSEDEGSLAKRKNKDSTADLKHFFELLP